MNEPNMIINKYGTKSWYLNGKRHREDGPAIEWPDGTKWWYLNDIKYSEPSFKIEMRKRKLDKMGF